VGIGFNEDIASQCSTPTDNSGEGAALAVVIDPLSHGLSTTARADCKAAEEFLEIRIVLNKVLDAAVQRPVFSFAATMGSMRSPAAEMAAQSWASNYAKVAPAPGISTEQQ
jgi:hypothetical protein